jgi:hypothetical protein
MNNGFSYAGPGDGVVLKNGYAPTITVCMNC